MKKSTIRDRMHHRVMATPKPGAQTSAEFSCKGCGMCVAECP